MLEKLIRHEWRETWKIPCLSCIVIILLTLVSTVCLMRMEPPAADDALNMGALLLTTCYSLFIACITLLITVYFAVRFYRNLYTDEGYLMHTLPVTPRQLILSKTLIASFWYFILSLLAVWSVLIILMVCMPVLAADAPAPSTEWLLENSRNMFGMSLPAFLAFYLALSLVSAVSNALILYGAISLGQLFTRHKVMASVLCYIGFTMLIQTVTTFFMTPFLTKLIIQSGNAGEMAGSTIPEFMGVFMRGTLLVSLAGSLLAALGSWILTEYVMKKQLNLD